MNMEEAILPTTKIDPMANKLRIMAQDILSVADVQALTGLPYSSAAKLIQRINFVSKDKLQMRGKVMTRNYVNFFEGGESLG